MQNITQHEAAELWEITRDHHVAAAKLELFCNQVSDTQLRSTLEQHARRYRQAGQQLEGFLHGTGSGSFGTSTSGFGQQSQAGTTGNGGTSYGMSGGFQQGAQHGSYGMNQSMDSVIVSDCLKDCKCLAVEAIQGALEAAQPARNFLFQLAGEHLQMAEQHYHWLERHGLYASPKCDQQAIQQYTQKLSQIAQSGQGAMRTQGMGQSQPQTQHYGYGSQYMQTGQSSQYGQSSQFGQSNPSGQSHQYSQQ